MNEVCRCCLEIESVLIGNYKKNKKKNQQQQKHPSLVILVVYAQLSENKQRLHHTYIQRSSH